MLPIVTPEEMRAIDAAAPETSEVLIARAGAAVARAAIRMMGGSYGRTVNIIVGKGNNGADGRAAGSRLAARGVRVRLFGAERCPDGLPLADLVIDAAYGTGFRGAWQPPDVGGVPVLAVDVPSGVDALDGRISGDVLAAAATVTLGALKPGLLLPPGAQLAGEVEVAEIGLGSTAAAAANSWLVTASDVAGWLPRRAATAHKWRAAVRLVAGNTAMSGAAALAARGAMRAGAGIVQLSSPGALLGDLPAEVVQRQLPVHRWSEEVLDNIGRFHALVVGPGLGRTDEAVEGIRRVVAEAPTPTVIDGDGLFAIAWASDGASDLLRRRTAPTVLTPHDGEFALLAGETPGPDRFQAARRLADDTGCVVLLKGAVTIVADPSGSVLVVTTGDARLATAGTGDVLAGTIGALLAAGVAALPAAAVGAWLHGRAAGHAVEHGMVAGDVADLLPTAWADALVGGE